MDRDADTIAAANIMFNHSEYPAPSSLRRGTSQQDLIGPWELVPLATVGEPEPELDTSQSGARASDDAGSSVNDGAEQHLQRQVAKVVFVCF